VTGLETERDRVVSRFRADQGDAVAEGPAWLPALRNTAIERFAALGFPTRRREDWKYTQVGPLAESIAAARGSHAAAELSGDARTQVEAAVVATAEGPALVFVDGAFAPGLSMPAAMRTDSDGLIVDSLAAVLRRDPASVEGLLTASAADEDRAFVALNTAFGRDGAVVRVGRGVTVERPIEIVHVAFRDGAVSHLRNLITLDESARAVVVEHFVSAGARRYLTNAVTTTRIGPNASLDHVVLETEAADARHVGTRSARIEANGALRSSLVSLGGALVRNETAATLAAPGADCQLDGLFVADGSRHVDNQTTIDHAAPHGTSRELYKGILGGRAHGIFNGGVIVRPDAQKTSAQQSNPNLLLADGAEIDTRPNLEIHADDVKCSHGSTVGRLDGDALFFLRARGIAEAEARRMLCGAFAAEIVERLPSEGLRERVGALVARAFDAGAEGTP